MTDRRFQSRPMALGSHAAVATPHLLASEAAIETLRAGGNAVDAAVTAAAVSTVVQPFSSSIGGLGWASVYDAGEAATEVLQFHGTVPRRVDPSVFGRDRSGLVDWRRLEASGRALLGSLTPTVVPGWEALLARKGTWPLRRVLERPIELAGEGVPVSELLHRTVAANAGRLARWEESAAMFLPDGRPVRPGERLVQADLAATLERIARHGAAEMVVGETAAMMLDFYQRHGGVLDAEDLLEYRPSWHPPLVATYGGYTVHAAPAPFGDVSFLAGLKLLECLGPFGGPVDADYLHASIETAKLVALERARYLGEGVDPAVAEGLLSEGHLRLLRDRVGREAAVLPAVAAGAEDTITLAVVDGAGNAVHLMQTVGHQFGTGAIAGRAGFFTNSSMYFVYVGHDGANRIVPGGRVEQNPCLALVFGPDAKLRLVAGSPGGKTRVETVRQMILNVLDFGLNLQEAVDARRFVTAADGITVDFESRHGALDADLRGELERRGHRVRMVEETFGTGQAVAVDPVTGTRMGAADWRQESIALAY